MTDRELAIRGVETGALSAQLALAALRLGLPREDLLEMVRGVYDEVAKQVEAAEAQLIAAKP